MKPGDPYYALYTRAVLPDEIDADPVEPAPDEGSMVERLQAIIRHEVAYDHTYESAVRAVLAEIASVPCVTLTEHCRVAFETAPRLTKGVRYRVVGASPAALFAVGHEFVANGYEALCLRESKYGDGWYELWCHGFHRVVRVEPEKAGKREECPHGVGLCTASCPSKMPHDGGGERSGQATEGPPRVGDVVSYVASECVVESTHGAMLRFKGRVSWIHSDEVTLLRRAYQPDKPPHGMFIHAKQVRDPFPHVGHANSPELGAGQPEAKPKWTHAAAVAAMPADWNQYDGEPEAKAEEKPVTGGPVPHAGTVADLVAWAQAVSCWLPTGAPEFSEIRAERARSGK